MAIYKCGNCNDIMHSNAPRLCKACEWQGVITMTTTQIITELTTIRNGIEGDTFTVDNINQLIKKLRG